MNKQVKYKWVRYKNVSGKKERQEQVRYWYVSNKQATYQVSVTKEESNRKWTADKNTNRQKLIINVQTCKGKERKMKLHNMPVSNKKH